MFEAMFTIVPILIAIGFGFTIALLLSPKLRGKMMARQMKSLKHMVEMSQEDLSDLSGSMLETSKKFINNNEEKLKYLSKKNAEINASGVEITARAIKKGFGKSDIYCKYCGSTIDADSRFCKNCGKEQ